MTALCAIGGQTGFHQEFLNHGKLTCNQNLYSIIYHQYVLFHLALQDILASALYKQICCLAFFHSNIAPCSLNMGCPSRREISIFFPQLRQTWRKCEGMGVRRNACFILLVFSCIHRPSPTSPHQPPFPSALLPHILASTCHVITEGDVLGSAFLRTECLASSEESQIPKIAVC